MFEEGDRVIYVSGNYGAAENNPLTPGSFSCEGTIDRVEVYHGGASILVLWDNGTNNSYSKTDLVSIIDKHKLNPNTAFRISKRRR